MMAHTSSGNFAAASVRGGPSAFRIWYCSANALLAVNGNSPTASS